MNSYILLVSVCVSLLLTNIDSQRLQAPGVVGYCPGNRAFWSVWQNSDDPTGQGDFEPRPSSTCAYPIAIQARTVGSQIPYTAAGNVVTISPQSGLFCNNSLNNANTQCADYEVRFCCRVGQYSAWHSQGCSVSCGTGVETFRRLCIRKPGELDCLAMTPLTKQQVCFRHPCATAGIIDAPFYSYTLTLRDSSGTYGSNVADKEGSLYWPITISIRHDMRRLLDSSNFPYAINRESFRYLIGKPTWRFSGGAAWKVTFESTSGGLKPLFKGFSSRVWNLQSIEVKNTGLSFFSIAPQRLYTQELTANLGTNAVNSMQVYTVNLPSNLPSNWFIAEMEVYGDPQHSDTFSVQLVEVRVNDFLIKVTRYDQGDFSGDGQMIMFTFSIQQRRGRYGDFVSQGCSVLCGNGIETLTRQCIRNTTELECLAIQHTTKYRPCKGPACPNPQITDLQLQRDRRLMARIMAHYNVQQAQVSQAYETTVTYETTVIHPCTYYNPCSNGGECVRGIGQAYTCKCKTGWRDSHCNSRVESRVRAFNSTTPRRFLVPNSSIRRSWTWLKTCSLTLTPSQLSATTSRSSISCSTNKSKWLVNTEGIGAWCPLTEANHAESYVQALFDTPTFIYSILTQGTRTNYVKTFQIEALVSRSPNVWQKPSKIYTANRDSETVVENVAGINMNIWGIRIYPVAFHKGTVLTPALRVGFKGYCPRQ